MERQQILAAKIANFVESVFVLVLGLYMHCTRWSLLEAEYSNSLVAKPDAASYLFVISALIALWNKSPKIPHTLPPLPKTVLHCVKVLTIIYLTELVFVQIWLAVMTVTYFFLLFVSRCIISVQEDFVRYYVPRISKFVQENLVYILRYLISTGAMYLMLEFVGIRNFIKRQFAANQVVELDTSVVAPSDDSEVSFEPQNLPTLNI